MKGYHSMLDQRTCQKCKRIVSPVGGKMHTGKLLRCADCRKSQLSLMAVTLLMPRK